MNIKDRVITIPATEHLLLVRDRMFLELLLVSGISQWEGYAEVCEKFNQTDWTKPNE